MRKALENIFEIVDSASPGAGATNRLNTLLADGSDAAGAELALVRAWDLVVPQPFGEKLARAVSALPASGDVIDELLNTGRTHDSEVAARLAPLLELESRGRVFRIADRDDQIAQLVSEHAASPDNAPLASSTAFELGRRFAIAGRMLIEQSDLIIAVWDGKTHANLGGTGDTVKSALHASIPVVWIEPARPADWLILRQSEMLGLEAGGLVKDRRDAELESLVRDALGENREEMAAALAAERYRPRSALRYHAYRRLETLFGNKGGARFASVRQTYETPEGIEKGSAREVLGTLKILEGEDETFPDRLRDGIFKRFAWMDAIATFLSDRHRSSMIVNFLLGSIAIIAGVLYLPLGGPDHKWIFASIELVVLLIIVVNTWRARNLDLHSRWFATRRAAEYLRSQAWMLALGVARPRGEWPSGENSGWPETYARHAAREVGLPQTTIDSRWLAAMLRALERLLIVPQLEYHRAKARRLTRVHHSLDKVSELLFAAAIVSVGCYLAVAALLYAGLIDPLLVEKIGKWCTVLGVAFPTIGGALAGMRYFGDFERFADISTVTAQRLEAVLERIGILEQAQEETLQYSDVAEIVRSVDAVVMAELESWQAVFSGKKVAVPV
ncbi:hypothetical protein [Aurantiacibacter hainanensis]|uniref:hypothetical protein n=1 Tax=Aurantiacibacter hainanensis TaxID=3076114 RepID=UPI0030C68008